MLGITSRMHGITIVHGRPSAVVAIPAWPTLVPAAVLAAAAVALLPAT
jgi:hypothetical protein